jgi:hypothetical protein
MVLVRSEHDSARHKNWPQTKFGAFPPFFLISDFRNPMVMSVFLATRIGLLCAGNQHLHKVG